MNVTEQMFVMEAESRGYKVLSSGWPDFLITNDEIIQGVEVKSVGDLVKDNQMSMLNALAESGLDCWIYRGEWKDPDIIKTDKPKLWIRKDLDEYRCVCGTDGREVTFPYHNRPVVVGYWCRKCSIFFYKNGDPNYKVRNAR